MYFSPYIDHTGYHYPSYPEIRDYLIEEAKRIFGNDLYLEPDSMDYQDISIRSLALYDAMQTLEQAYNNMSPATAVGAGLDLIVAINGLARKSASHSMCPVILTGTAGTVIHNGVVTDTAGNKWDLPTPVTIGAGGTLTVTAICQAPGAITIGPHALTIISTPTAGWISVTNNIAATPGLPVESDSELRARQAISTGISSKTLLSGTMAAIAAISGVKRWQVYENYTSTTDGNGLVPHSIWAVVEGGDDNEIARAIYLNKGIGCGVNGMTTVAVTDPDYNTVTNIKFSRPTYVSIYVTINGTEIKGYTTAMGAAIKAAVADYLNALQIGEKVTRSALFAVALSVMDDLKVPNFSISNILLGTSSPPMGTSDIPISFNAVSSCVPANVTVNIT